MKKLPARILLACSVTLLVLTVSSLLAGKYFESNLNDKTIITEALGENGLEGIIHKHKGRLLYVDHSSVNCGPCYKEMRDFVPALQKRYEHKPITFVYICSESNYPVKTFSNGVLWRRKLSKLKPGGFHYLINRDLSMKIFDQTVKKSESPYYPWQFIVDENGNIINSHAERPSDSLKLYKQLDSLLLTRK